MQPQKEEKNSSALSLCAQFTQHPVLFPVPAEKTSRHFYMNGTFRSTSDTMQQVFLPFSQKHLTEKAQVYFFSSLTLNLL